MTRSNELSEPVQRRLGVTFASTSAILFILASYYAYDQWQLNQNGVIVTGEVIAVGKKNAYPTVRFEAPDRKTYEFKESRYSAFADKVQPGDSIEVIFDLKHPHDAYVVDTQWVGVEMAYLAAISTGIFGVMCLSRRIRASSSLG